MVEDARRFIDGALPLGSVPVGENGRLLSPLGQARLVHAAKGVLGSIEGLQAVNELDRIVARLLAEDALRLRRELERNGLLSPRGDRG